MSDEVSLVRQKIGRLFDLGLAVGYHDASDEGTYEKRQQLMTEADAVWAELFSADGLPAAREELAALARERDGLRLALRASIGVSRHLEEWIEAHGQHPPTCGAARGGGCDCGLDELRG